MGNCEHGGGGAGVVKMRGRVGEEVSKYKNTLMPSSAIAERFFSEQRIFFDDERGLSGLHY